MTTSTYSPVRAGVAWLASDAANPRAPVTGRLSPLVGHAEGVPKLSAEHEGDGLAMQALWVAIGAIGVRVVWRFAIRHYGAVGG